MISSLSFKQHQQFFLLLYWIMFGMPSEKDDSIGDNKDVGNLDL
jgi:hypothetical protein